MSRAPPRRDPSSRGVLVVEGRGGRCQAAPAPANAGGPSPVPHGSLRELQAVEERPQVEGRLRPLVLIGAPHEGILHRSQRVKPEQPPVAVREPHPAPLKLATRSPTPAKYRLNAKKHDEDATE